MEIDPPPPSSAPSSPGISAEQISAEDEFFNGPQNDHRVPDADEAMTEMASASGDDDTPFRSASASDDPPVALPDSSAETATAGALFYLLSQLVVLGFTKSAGAQSSRGGRRPNQPHDATQVDDFEGAVRRERCVSEAATPAHAPPSMFVQNNHWAGVGLPPPPTNQTTNRRRRRRHPHHCTLPAQERAQDLEHQSGRDERRPDGRDDCQRDRRT